MKNSKKGISLIVLVITVIVIIILAAAVILTMQKSNPIADARVAVEKEDYTEAQNAYNMWLSKVMVKQLDTVTFTGTIVNSKFATEYAAGFKSNNAVPTKFKTKITSTVGANTVTSSGAALNSEAISLVDDVTLDQIGLPDRVKVIYVENNKVVGLVKDATVSSLNVSNDVISVDTTI